MKAKDVLVDRNNLFVALVIMVAVLMGLAAAACSSIDTSNQSNTYQTNVSVAPADGPNASLGIATGSGLSYGRMIVGSNFTKTLELSSQQLAVVESTATGNISNNLYFDEKILFRNDTDIEYMYAGKESGYYEGNITLDIKTADNRWGERWLKLRYRLPF